MVITELLATLADIEICPDFGDSRSQYLQFNTERYRSGHNGADSKSVCLNGHEGSNPSLSAKCGFHRTRKPQSRDALRLFHTNERVNSNENISIKVSLLRR